MIDLTRSEIEIMGAPNFSCAQRAKILMRAGIYRRIEKAEYEQAIYIHWALDLYKKHGENWMEIGNKILVDYVKGFEKEILAKIGIEP